MLLGEARSGGEEEQGSKAVGATGSHGEDPVRGCAMSLSNFEGQMATVQDWGLSLKP